MPHTSKLIKGFILQSTFLSHAVLDTSSNDGGPPVFPTRGVVDRMAGPLQQPPEYSQSQFERYMATSPLNILNPRAVTFTLTPSPSQTSCSFVTLLQVRVASRPHLTHTIGGHSSVQHLPALRASVIALLLACACPYGMQ